LVSAHENWATIIWNEENEEMEREANVNGKHPYIEMKMIQSDKRSMDMINEDLITTATT
jgi:hypothetical protein